MTKIENSGKVRKMLQAGTLAIAALFAPQSTHGGDPVGVKLATVERQTDEDPFFTDQLDIGYHVKNLSSHPRYRAFSIKNADYIRGLAATEEKHKFAAIIMIQFGEYLHAELTDEEKVKDQIYKYYYGGKVYSHDIGSKVESTYRYNGYIMPQNQDVIVLAYGFHKSSGQLIETEVVSINPNGEEVKADVEELIENKKFRNQLASLDSNKVSSGK